MRSSRLRSAIIAGVLAAMAVALVIGLVALIHLVASSNPTPQQVTGKTTVVSTGNNGFPVILYYFILSNGTRTRVPESIYADTGIGSGYVPSTRIVTPPDEEKRQIQDDGSPPGVQPPPPQDPEENVEEPPENVEPPPEPVEPIEPIEVPEG